jgi:protoporphyrinogen oxidase
MRWVVTSMGCFIDGRLHEWGNPYALLRFPGLNFVQKIRYGVLMFISTRRDRWDSLEHRNARDWITRWCGAAVYDRMWRPLFDLKFHQYVDDVSAAWIWRRIRRIGRSRRNLMQEELGYIEGGSETLVRALVDAIEAAGGQVVLSAPVTRILTEANQVTGVLAGGIEQPADAVICTVPTPFVPLLVPDLPEPAREAYRAIVNTGVVCVVLRLARSVSPHFWVNINDADIEIPGIIEFSNLRPCADHIVYVPYYMPASHPKWSWSEAAFIDDAFACLERINPALRRDELITAHVARLRHAQPICPPGFQVRLPPVQTAVAGLQIADTCFYYPEDRGIAESIRLGQMMADRI